MTNKPIICAGNYTPETALKGVEEGRIDYVMIGRGLIADPHFPTNYYMVGRRYTPLYSL